MTFLLLFEDLRCFNYLSNSVEQRTGIEISGIQPDIRYPAPTGYPDANPVSGFQNGRISGKTAIRSIPINNIRRINLFSNRKSLNNVQITRVCSTVNNRKYTDIFNQRWLIKSIKNRFAHVLV